MAWGRPGLRVPVALNDRVGAESDPLNLSSASPGEMRFGN